MQYKSDNYRAVLNTRVRVLTIQQITTAGGLINDLIDAEQKTRVYRRAVSTLKTRAVRLAGDLIDVKWYEYTRRGDITNALKRTRDDLAKATGGIDYYEREQTRLHGLIDTALTTIHRA
jgi:hypothetical protein